MQMCKDTSVNFVLVGNNHLMTECKGFEETRNWSFHETVEEAKASFAKTATPAMASA
jgi:two-component system cell cycle response regulator